jgi:hypothetical protein
MGYGLTINCHEPIGNVWIDEARNVRWDVGRDSVDLWADDVLVISLHANEVRTPFCVSCLPWIGVDGPETLAVGEWTVESKWLHARVNGVCVASIDVVGRTIYCAAVDAVSGVTGSHAPVPIWGRWADCVLQHWHGESGLWMTAGSVSAGGLMVTTLRVCSEADCLAV